LAGLRQSLADGLCNFGHLLTFRNHEQDLGVVFGGEVRVRGVLRFIAVALVLVGNCRKGNSATLSVASCRLEIEIRVSFGIMKREADRALHVTYESSRCVELEESGLVKVVGCESREKYEMCWPRAELNTGYNKKARIWTHKKVFNSVGVLYWEKKRKLRSKSEWLSLNSSPKKGAFWMAM
ncbi:hypothetical protein KCU85_g60, partial [Aureobasidium melanogenum]